MQFSHLLSKYSQIAARILCLNLSCPIPHDFVTSFARAGFLPYILSLIIIDTEKLHCMRSGDLEDYSYQQRWPIYIEKFSWIKARTLRPKSGGRPYRCQSTLLRSRCCSASGNTLFADVSYPVIVVTMPQKVGGRQSHLLPKCLLIGLQSFLKHLHQSN
jgi:hypothetical protein